MTPIPDPMRQVRSEIFEQLEKLREVIQEIDERIVGLGMTPLALREVKFEKLKAEREEKMKEETALMERIRELPTPG